MHLSVGATEAEIKKAYRVLAKQYHPDKNIDEPKSIKEKHYNLFTKIGHGYQILMNPSERRLYDTKLNLHKDSEKRKRTMAPETPTTNTRARPTSVPSYSNVYGSTYAPSPPPVYPPQQQAYVSPVFPPQQRTYSQQANHPFPFTSTFFKKDPMDLFSQMFGGSMHPQQAQATTDHVPRTIHTFANTQSTPFGQFPVGTRIQVKQPFNHPLYGRMGFVTGYPEGQTRQYICLMDDESHVISESHLQQIFLPVTIHGLINFPQYNGEKGILYGYHREHKEKYHVCLDPGSLGKSLPFYPKNVILPVGTKVKTNGSVGMIMRIFLETKEYEVQLVNKTIIRAPFAAVLL